MALQDPPYCEESYSSTAHCR